MSQDQPQRPPIPTMADEYPQSIKPGDVFPSHRDLVARAEREALLNNNELTGTHGLSVTSIDLPGKRIITATADGQVISQFTVPSPSADMPPQTNAVTIGEALDTAAETAAERAVDRADAAAVQAAERRATGKCGGVSAAVQRAAELNERVGGEEEKVKMGEVVGGATERMERDKVVTREDAERVVAAEGRWGGGEREGVAEAVVAAARVNKERV